MHKDFQRPDQWSRRSTGAAIEAPRDKGPGLVESIHGKCLELRIQGIPAVNQLIVPVEYKGYVFDEPLKLDVCIDPDLIRALNAVQKMLPEHNVQRLNYMKRLNTPVGLIINFFHEMGLKAGIPRLILRGADQP